MGAYTLSQGTGEYPVYRDCLKEWVLLFLEKSAVTFLMVLRSIFRYFNAYLYFITGYGRVPCI